MRKPTALWMSCYFVTHRYGCVLPAVQMFHSLSGSGAGQILHTKKKEWKEIASVHFNDLFSAWFIYNDLNQNLSLIYEDLQKKSKQMSGS